MSENKFTPRAEEVLRLSQEAAEDLGHGYVGSEHLLLGLIREEEGCVRGVPHGKQHHRHRPSADGPAP